MHAIIYHIGSHLHYLYCYKMMMMMQWLFFFLFLFSTSYMSIVQSRCTHEAEISALLHFKDEFEINCADPYDPFSVGLGYDYDDLGYQKTSTWDNAESLLNGTAEWDGVECDPVSGHVIGLDLSSSCLYGSFNSSTSSIFKLLLHLEQLNLAFNNFQDSSIPSELGNLLRLSYLNLSSSSFVGHVPFEISKLSVLTSLDLSNNIGLELNLKRLVRNLTNLEELDLSSTNPMPSEIPKLLFTNVSSLRSLKLDNCRLKGQFPQGIFHLPKLQHLSIQGNGELEGHLPTDFNLSTTPLLESLLVSGTKFNGTIPVSIGSLILLRELDLSSCNFSGGPIPASLGNLTHLIRLDLSSITFFPSNNNFTSLCSSWVGKLTKLRYLHISEANLIGEIPPSCLANLTDLSELDLSGNQLTGQIPSVVARLSQLSYLRLLNNQLTGEIPPGLFNLTKLTYLDVSKNRLHGPLPIQTLRILEYLDVGNNQLNDTLELDMFLEFTNLTVLFLSFNNLTLLQQHHQRNVSSNSILSRIQRLGLSSCRLSKFPEFLMHQQDLMSVDLSYNSIEGPIPMWMGSIDSLVSINLSHNLITSVFDEKHLFLPWPYAINLDISYNKMQGTVPIPSPFVWTYKASNNEFTGEIPQSLCNLTSLQVIDFSSNRLTGELHSHCFNNKPSLTTLNLRNNSFHGKIPDFCGDSTDRFFLAMIDLNNNQFQGKIPRSLADCSKLEFFNAGSNLINDTFPSWLGSLRDLKVVILKDNALHGSIGKLSNMRSRHWFPKLIIIDLSQNSLSGNLTSWNFDQLVAMKADDLRNPSYIGQDMSGFEFHTTFYDYSLTMYNKGTETEYLKILNALITIDLSSNKFEGNIPSTIGDLRGLHFLNLSNNHLYGSIPSSLGDLTKLESLDLSSNRLSGQIPQQLAGLDFLSAFNVSHNNLTGLIPQGRHFDTFTNISFLGNPGLCGEPLSRKCETPGQESERPPEEMARKEDNFWDDLNANIVWMVVSIGCGGGLIVGVAVENTVDWRMWILYFQSRNWRRRSGGQVQRRN